MLNRQVLGISKGQVPGQGNACVEHIVWLHMHVHVAVKGFGLCLEMQPDGFGVSMWL